MTELRPVAARREIRAIQVLRGVAAMMVVWHHAAGQIAGMSTWVPWQFGTSGVDLFFVISGFIMVVTTRSGKVSPFDFWRRRIVRVVPLYWVLTLSMVAVAFAMPSLFRTLQVTPITLLQSLFFVPHFSRSFAGQVWPLLVPGWTLNFEMFFYAVFGAALFLPGRARLPALTAGLLALFLIGAIFGPFASAPAQTYTHPMLLEFVAGAWIATLWLYGRLRLSAAASIAMVVLGGALLVMRDQQPLGYVNQIVGAALMVAGTVNPRFDRWKFKFWQAVGDSSYSLYLTHLFTLGVLRSVWTRLIPAPPDAGTTAVFMVVALGVCAWAGWCTYRVIELPLLRRLQTPRRPAGRSAPAAP